MEEKEKTLSDNFSEEERMELFKSAFSNLVVSSELPVSIIYYFQNSHNTNRQKSLRGN